MNRLKKKKTTTSSQETIDRLVASQADDDLAWEPPIRVRRSKPASLLIPGELAARATFLARLHREPGLSTWVERILRERVELEEIAFSKAKKELAS
jgi:hypothetical protein